MTHSCRHKQLHDRKGVCQRSTVERYFNDEIARAVRARKRDCCPTIITQDNIQIHWTAHPALFVAYGSNKYRFKVAYRNLEDITTNSNGWVAIMADRGHSGNVVVVTTTDWAPVTPEVCKYLYHMTTREAAILIAKDPAGIKGVGRHYWYAFCMPYEQAVQQNQRGLQPPSECGKTFTRFAYPYFANGRDWEVTVEHQTMWNAGSRATQGKSAVIRVDGSSTCLLYTSPSPRDRG